jgi:hypothetical protein
VLFRAGPDSNGPGFDTPGGTRFRRGRRVPGLPGHEDDVDGSYSSAFTMSSTTFFASPKTIMVLSM